MEINGKKYYMIESGMIVRYEIPKPNMAYHTDPSFFWDYSFGNKEGYSKEISIENKNKKLPQFMLLELKDGIYYEALTKFPILSEQKKATGNGVYYREKRNTNDSAILEIRNEQQYNFIKNAYDNFGAVELKSLFDSFYMRGYLNKNKMEILEKGKKR